MKIASFQSTPLASGLVGAPAISGDGRTVVWNQNVDGNVDIYRSKDGVVDRLTTDERQDIHPTVNHDGSVITWNRFSTVDPNDKEGNFDVVVWKDGVETVIADGPANQVDPKVSTDGTRITWDSDVDGSERTYRIELHENGKTERLTPDDQWNLYPTFAGTGERMIWSEFRPGGSDLVLRDQTGTIKPITYDDAQEVRPAPSADGQIVFFSQVSPQGDDDLFRLSLEPYQLEPVAAEKDVDEAWPVCSADGRTVAWTNFDRRNGGEGAETHIYVNGQQATAGEGMHTNVSISADGSKFAYLWIDSEIMENRRIVLAQRSTN
jgi:Tol biopolymer transport system component